MMKKQKINLVKVRASLGTPYAKMWTLIPPAPRRFLDFNHFECPKCSERFIPACGAY
jgi:hypothetical protein